ncbi:MAG TPA: S9 family peptidase, partial [Dermatophilaceae bacterium]|nr:S9 family peptidase [Dermatophilaceae bacterium]
MRPPRAPRSPVARTIHGDTVVDDYAWMADRDDPRLTAYLEAENAYAAHRTAHVAPLATAIYDEIAARTVETDLSVPVRHSRWWYYSRTTEGLSYPIHARVPIDVSPERPDLTEGQPPLGEEILLDENAAAGDSDYFALAACEVSPDGRLVAWAADRSGDERYDVVVTEIATGRVLDDAVTGAGETLAWASDSATFVYTRIDESWRPHEVWRHAVGSAPSEDSLVLAEPDGRFFLAVGVSKDERWIVVVSSSKSTTLVWLLDAARSDAPPYPIAPSREGVLMDVEPYAGGLLVTHNSHRSNFEVSWLPWPTLDAEDMPELTSLGWSSSDELVVGVEAYAGSIVVALRSGGRPGLRVIPIDDPDEVGPAAFGVAHDVVVAGETTVLALGSTPDPDSPTVQVVLESMARPAAVYDYDVSTRSFTLLKQRVVPHYDLGVLRERRLWAVASDGARVPISIVYHERVTPDGTAPLLLTGYGAYGIATDPYFSVARLSLLDRGVVVAIAHVRGGTELGWDWYESGRRAAKPATFADFVACADHVVESGWSAPDQVAAEGGSAGGLLIGAAVNARPELFRVVHAQVPFVDALTTMLDPTLPLTMAEQEEWGDPITDPAAYALLRSYSPYDNVAAGDYPAILVTTNLHDTRVFVTEPAKWVARLRDRATDDDTRRPIIFRTDLSSGHAGRSGRYQAWEDVAWEWAVLLDLLGVNWDGRLGLGVALTSGPVRPGG